MTTPKITHDSKPYLAPAIATLHPQFTADPVINFLLQNLPDQAANAYREKFFRTMLEVACTDHAVFYEADDWSCCAVWLPPGRKVGSLRSYLNLGFVDAIVKLGISGLKRAIVDYQGQSDRVKKTALKGYKRFHYLFFIATQSHARGKGLSSAMIRDYQSLAAKDGAPIWLEATTQHSRDIYARLGFQVAGTMNLGKGSVDGSGVLHKGGEGVTVWCMLWVPEGLKKQG